MAEGKKKKSLTRHINAKKKDWRAEKTNFNNVVKLLVERKRNHAVLKHLCCSVSYIHVDIFVLFKKCVTIS